MTTREDAREFTINSLVEAGIVSEAFEDDALARLVEHDDAHRAEVLTEAIEAARTEYLHEQTGTPEDEAYNQGVTDAVAAIGALLEPADDAPDGLPYDLPAGFIAGPGGEQ